jgi:hypothetical protein
VNTVVADRPGTFEIETDGDWQPKSIFVLPGAPFHRAVPVVGTTVDPPSEQLQLAPIDFLKMNIEGAERLAILGMKHALRRVRHLCVACHDFRADRSEGEHYRTRDVVIEFLKQQGYRWYFALTTHGPQPATMLTASRGKVSQGSTTLAATGSIAGLRSGDLAVGRACWGRVPS